MKRILLLFFCLCLLSASAETPVAPAQTMLTQMPAATCTLDTGADDAVRHNVAEAAASVYDTTLESGDMFSFNAIVGPRKEAFGFVEALNGRGVTVVGGGVAQVASAIWLCIRGLDNVVVTEKVTYGEKFNQTYVDNASDAILVDWKNDADFRFRYTGNGTLTIYTRLDGHTLICEVYEQF